MPTLATESFSITYASVLDGVSEGAYAPLYGVRNGSIDISTSSVNNTGDDSILSVWSYFDEATVTIETGFITFGTLATLAGTNVTAANNVWTVPLWNANSLNQLTRPLLFRTPSRLATGETGWLDFILYRVEFGPISLSGPSYKNGLITSFNGNALSSPYDERGNTLVEPSIGRLRYSPRSIVVTDSSIVDNGDGTYTITSNNISDNGDQTIMVLSSQAVDNGDGTYTVTY